MKERLDPSLPAAPGGGRVASPEQLRQILDDLQVNARIIQKWADELPRTGKSAPDDPQQCCELFGTFLRGTIQAIEAALVVPPAPQQERSRDMARALDALLGEIEAAGDEQKKTAWIQQAWHRRLTWVRWLRALRNQFADQFVAAVPPTVPPAPQDQFTEKELWLIASMFGDADVPVLRRLGIKAQRQAHALAGPASPEQETP